MRITGILVTICLCLLCLTGCGSKAEEQSTPLKKHSGNYSSTANITYKELQATATITQESPQSCAVVFSSPPSLKDMAFVFHKDNVDLNYKGMSFSFNPNSLPGGAVAGMAVSAINTAMRDDGLQVELADDALEVSGVMQSGEFKLRLDAKNGNLLKLSVPAEELEIEFVNFQFLD